MPDLPTIDELVEVGAKALYLLKHGQQPDRPIGVDKHGYNQEPYVRTIPAWRWFCGADARAILTAVLPLVLRGACREVGRAASVCENFQKSEDDGYRSRDRQYAVSMLKDARSTLSSIDSLIGPRPE